MALCCSTDLTITHTTSTRELCHCTARSTLDSGISQSRSIGVTLADGCIFLSLLLLHFCITCKEDSKEITVLLWRRVYVIIDLCFHISTFTKVCYNLEGVALIDEVLLSLSRVEHFLSIGTDQSIKEGIEG